MKEGIHPPYGAASIHCACGNVIETRSATPGTIQVDICSACHPFFTGRQKLLDTAGRIDRFKKKFGTRVALGNQKPGKKSAKPVPAPKAKKEPAAKSSGLAKLKEVKDKNKNQQQ